MCPDLHAPTILVLLAIVASMPAATVHVAPTGDDAAPGSAERPFATLMRAQQAVGPGDTVLIHGGTYRMQESHIARRRGIWAYVHLFDKSGAPDRRITWRAAPGERPVFDFSAVKPPGLRVHAFQITGSWLHFRDIEVVGVQVTERGHTQSICFASDGSHNILESLRLHDGMAIGIYHVRGSHNLFLNCDAWNNDDTVSEDGKGGNTDGFGCHPTKGSVGNVFRGCRAWFNSDDGFDCIHAYEAVTFDQCWAYGNGYTPGFQRRADGNGFKVGGWGATPADKLPSPMPRHVVTRCLAVRNKAAGFYANHQPGGGDWFNNTAWRNGIDFSMLGRTADNVTDIPGTGHRLRNNVSHGAKRPLANCDLAACEAVANTFTDGIATSDSDFAGLDEQQFTMPRAADGSLPVVALLRPVAGSVLIDRGVETGLPFRGTEPDLGAFER